MVWSVGHLRSMKVKFLVRPPVRFLTHWVLLQVRGSPEAWATQQGLTSNACYVAECHVDI